MQQTQHCSSLHIAMDPFLRLPKLPAEFPTLTSHVQSITLEHLKWEPRSDMDDDENDRWEMAEEDDYFPFEEDACGSCMLALFPELKSLKVY